MQSRNGFIVFGTMAVGSFLSGGLVASYGWSTVLWLSFLPLVVTLTALASSAASRRARMAG